MRTRPAHIEPGCPYCNEDHDPDIECRYAPRFLLGTTRPRLISEHRRITDENGKLVAVKVVYREGAE
jgi:hypothetical protein